MNGFMSGDEGLPGTGKVSGYSEYRSMAKQLASVVPGTLLVTASNRWSTTSILAGVRCRLPEATVIFSHAGETSVIDTLLMIAKMKAEFQVIEQRFLKHVNDDVRILYERVSGSFAIHGPQDIINIRTNGI
jgi:hypothetical protein